MPIQSPTQAQLQLLLPPRTHLRVTNRGSIIWLANVDRMQERAMLRILLAAFLAGVAVSGSIIAGLQLAGLGTGGALGYLVRHLLIGTLVAVALALLCFYLIYIPLVGRNHHVIFDMDDTGLMLIYVQRHAHRGDLRFDLATLADAATGRDNAAGLLTCSRTAHIRYSDLKKVVVDPENCIITLYGHDMARHRIYTSEQDFGFVAAYIHKHCSTAVAIRQKR